MLSLSKKEVPMGGEAKRRGTLEQRIYWAKWKRKIFWLINLFRLA
jgi:hypothetical protein